MIYDVRHQTRLSYNRPVAHAVFNLRLRPWAFPHQRLIAASLECDPVPVEMMERSGPFLANTTTITCPAGLKEIVIISRFRMAIVALTLPTGGPMSRDVAQAALGARDLSPLSPSTYLFPSRIAALDPAIGDWAAGQFDPALPIVPAVAGLMTALHGILAYRPGTTTSRTLPAEAFAARAGVCQDFAHVMIVALRWLGIPAAYASGYLRTTPPPGRARLVGADAMHAWVNVWCGAELGWVGFDPTNNCLAGDGHLQIAMGRDFADVAPIDGLFIGADPQSHGVSVDVVAVDEAG